MGKALESLMRLWDRYILGRRVSVSGERNKVHFGDGVKTDLTISIRGNGNEVRIGARTRIKGTIDIKGDGHSVLIGADGNLRGVTITCREGCGVTIGDGILTSTDVRIRTSDSHSIFDMATGERTNPARPVTIGDHVWLARGVTISKATIPSNCIVAAQSFVNAAFDEEHTLIGGAPARILRSGVAWTKELKPRL
jgi:acetyltransferase-like isoleucine patch superfamily enzyme